jgi:hypothetical protein
MNKTIYLVSCVSRKQLGCHKAKELYTSDWFNKTRIYVEKTSKPWYILSAEYGLVKPEEMITNYNKTLNKMPISDRRNWAKQVIFDLQSIVSPGDEIIFFAGQRYREFLIEPLQEMGIITETPMLGLQIGKQLQWMKQKLSE